MLWRLDGKHAFLQCGELAAEIDLASPSEGLRGIKFRDIPLSPFRLFQLMPGTVASSVTESPTDIYIRGGDLVASYAPIAEYPISRQVYWRALDDADRGQSGVELWISPQTSVLVSDPLLACTTVLPVCELHQLAVADSGDFVQHVVNDMPTIALGSESGTGAFLFRPADADWTYCQMVHPADFAEVTISTAGESLIRLTALLFLGEPLEKGVIRRARVRGLFMPRQHDSTCAVDAYQRFASSELPLTA
jgi:hypothetical protein